MTPLARGRLFKAILEDDPYRFIETQRTNAYYYFQSMHINATKIGNEPTADASTRLVRNLYELVEYLFNTGWQYDYVVVGKQQQQEHVWIHAEASNRVCGLLQ